MIQGVAIWLRIWSLGLGLAASLAESARPARHVLPALVLYYDFTLDFCALAMFPNEAETNNPHVFPLMPGVARAREKEFEVALLLCNRFSTSSASVEPPHVTEYRPCSAITWPAAFCPR